MAAAPPAWDAGYWIRLSTPPSGTAGAGFGPTAAARCAAAELELLSLDENALKVRGLDAINGTPVLDLKPA